jgi:hypothetical protein
MASCDDSSLRDELISLFHAKGDNRFSTLPARYKTMFGKELQLRKGDLRDFIEEWLDYSVVYDAKNPGRCFVLQKASLQNKSPSKSTLQVAPSPAQNKTPSKSPVLPKSANAVLNTPAGNASVKKADQLVARTAKKVEIGSHAHTEDAEDDMCLTPLTNEFTMLSLHPDASTHHPGKRTLSSCMFERRSQKADKAEPYHLLTDGYSLTGSCGLLGERHSDDVSSSLDDEVVSEEDCVYVNTEAPFCAICIGVQGAGKSHTMNVMLENCLLPHTSDDVDRPIINTRQPMAGLVLHFDQSQSNVCEAVGLNEPAHWLRWPNGACPPKMVVLVSPTFYHQRKLFYAGVDVEVLPLLFDWSTITATQLRKLMRLCDTDAQLYVSTMLSTLRDYQRNSKIPRFDVFLEETVEKCNANGQSAPLQQVYSANALNAVVFLPLCVFTRKIVEVGVVEELRARVRKEQRARTGAVQPLQAPASRYNNMVLWII